jgi:hypothetical protein
VRVSPLQDTIVAVRPIVPVLPFGVPDSKRPLNPMMPIGAHGAQNGPNGTEAGFNNTDANGNPIAPIVNEVVDLGWEYVFHCHILSHEEMDMMRPVTVHVGRALPTAPVLSFTRGSVILQWTDGTPVDYANPASWASPGTAEIGYRIERALVTNGVPGPYAVVGSAVANATTYTDVTADPTTTYDYRVVAWNAAGDAVSNAITVEGLPVAPAGLTATVEPAPALPAGAQVALAWTNNANNATSVVVERSVGGGAYSVLATVAPTDTTYVDTTVLPGPYGYQVRAVNAVGPSTPAGPVTVTVGQPGSTTVVLNAPNPSLVGQSVTFTATVSPVLATGTPTGTVIFTVDGATTTLALDLTGTAAYTTAALAEGTHTVTADYGGDAIFTASTASTTQTVQRAATATTVVSSVNPSTAGDSVTFTATVSPTTATGTMQFTIDGAVAATVPLVLGQAAYTTSALAVGGHLVVAGYSGDTAYLPSTSPTLTQTVGPALRATTTVVTSNRVPSANFGQSITFTATVRPVTGTGIPTGSVQFSIDGVDVGVPVTLNAQGRATYVTSSLPAGSHAVIAVYSGSTVFAGGGSLAYDQVVNKANTTTTVTSNRNPSVFGQTVTFTARVTPVAAGGTVTIVVDGVANGPFALDATGRATLPTSLLSVGTHAVTAYYDGSANYNTSNSAILTQTVNKAASRTAVTTSGSPADVGTTVVFTATVTPVAPGSGSPTGTVQFSVDGNPFGGPVALTATGQAVVATDALPVGRHTVVAVYSGDGNFNTSTSPSTTQRIR